MAKSKKTETEVPEPEGLKLASEWKSAWDALQPIRATWDEKEQALLAQANDSASGNVTAARVTDAALSTLAFERQARVSAQLPTGRVYALSKADDKKAKLLNVILTRYILPNADAQFDMLIKLRLWGVYASVYGSMPMFYDYRVDDRYIGPECYLVDPRCFAPVAGYNNVQDAGCFVSTIMSNGQLEDILEREKTTYNKDAIKKLLRLAKDGKPTRDNDSTKNNSTVDQRYDKSSAKNRVEVVTKYTSDKWISFAPDYEGIVIREMDNPHKSGRVPVIMRHCFPLLNSIFGLGDFERGMKIQKAKDSIINLFLEGAKNRVYPPLLMNDSLLTPSTIKRQAGTKWKVKDLDKAVKAFDNGAAPLNEFQATYASLQSMLQNQFGTSDTSITTEDSGNPAFGKTPAALKMLSQRENARDTWDRFMHEKATEELFEGMLNLLHVKMEKPINMSVFEDEIIALGDEVEGLEVFDNAKAGKLTIKKSDIKSDTGYSYLVDANSSMKQDDEEQFQALMATWGLMHSDPMMERRLAVKGQEYDEADHIKKIFIAAGISDWEKIIKELSPEKQSELQAQAEAEAMAQQQAQMQPPVDPNAAMMAQMPPQQMAPQQPQQAPAMFEDPQVAEVANMILGGM